MHSHSYLHALRLLPGMGSKTLESLIEHFGDAETAWRTPASGYRSLPDIGPKTVEAMARTKEHIDPAKEWERLAKQNIAVLHIDDALYPPQLREIPDRPYVLYTRGSFDWPGTRPMISIVGSRKYTTYGERAAFRLAEDLARAGITVVSGLAFGVDSIAHAGVLEAGGETIAVLGSGIDHPSISPQSHIALAERVMRQGALLSEYPPGTPGSKGTFPARNRIIAGLSLGTIVIEAAEESGSLITARLAVDYNREVFAVPGPIFSPVSLGTNRLIRQGAKIVTCLNDILEELNVSSLASTTSEKNTDDLSANEAEILKNLSHEPLHVDKIIKATRLNIASLHSSLAVLEIKGYVKNVGGMNYIRS